MFLNYSPVALTFGTSGLRGLVKDITDAVVKNAGTTPDQVTVSLVETAKTSKAKGGVLFAEMPARK